MIRAIPATWRKGWDKVLNLFIFHLKLEVSRKGSIAPKKVAISSLGRYTVLVAAGNDVCSDLFLIKPFGAKTILFGSMTWKCERIEKGL
jgi:hypothetical protein